MSGGQPAAAAAKTEEERSGFISEMLKMGFWGLLAAVAISWMVSIFAPDSEWGKMFNGLLDQLKKALGWDVAEQAIKDMTPQQLAEKLHKEAGLPADLATALASQKDEVFKIIKEKAGLENAESLQNLSSLKPIFLSNPAVLKALFTHEHIAPALLKLAPLTQEGRDQLREALNKGEVDFNKLAQALVKTDIQQINQTLMKTILDSVPESRRNKIMGEVKLADILPSRDELVRIALAKNAELPEASRATPDQIAKPVNYFFNNIAHIEAILGKEGISEIAQQMRSGKQLPNLTKLDAVLSDPDNEKLAKIIVNNVLTDPKAMAALKALGEDANLQALDQKDRDVAKFSIRSLTAHSEDGKTPNLGVAAELLNKNPAAFRALITLMSDGDISTIKVNSTDIGEIEAAAKKLDFDQQEIAEALGPVARAAAEAKVRSTLPSALVNSTNPAARTAIEQLVSGAGALAFASVPDPKSLGSVKLGDEGSVDNFIQENVIAPRLQKLKESQQPSAR